jgi:hypothetical protein
MDDNYRENLLTWLRLMESGAPAYYATCERCFARVIVGHRTEYTRCRRCMTRDDLPSP